MAISRGVCYNGCIIEMMKRGKAMRIIFVRHGEPDYARDCLTDEGRKQAATAAERLVGEGISKIYASPCGRAAETASYTARALDLPVETLEYMREITWGGSDIPVEGHPWTLGDWLIERENFDFGAESWREHAYFAGNAATRCYDAIAEAFDALLMRHGYVHDGGRFLCQSGTDETVALFSHGGSGGCALSHLLALPLPYVLSVMPYDFTSIIIVELPARPGECVRPRLELFNDCRHIRHTAGGPRIQQRPDGE